MLADSITRTLAMGMDQRTMPISNAFSLLQNVYYNDSLFAWDTLWGWEPVRPWNADRVYSGAEATDNYSGFSWSTHQGRIEYLLQERQVTGAEGLGLFYELADGTSTLVDIGRNGPFYDDPGTQYIPFGRMLIVINGSRGIKFFGDNLITPFLVPKPGAPQVVKVDPSRLCPDSSGLLEDDTDGQSTNEGQGIALYPHIWTEPTEWSTDAVYVLPSGNTLNASVGQGVPGAKSYYGLGTVTVNDQNTYSYKVAWVTDSGSESEASESTTVSWVIPDEHDSEGVNADNANPFEHKLSVLISDLPIGPDNVVGRRIYRTRNKKDGLTGSGDEYYLVATIRDNCVRTYVDTTPDNELIIPAPGLSGASVITSSYKYGAVYDSRLWLGGGSSTETSLVYSEAGKPEQFGGLSFFDVGVRDGGGITAIQPYASYLIVFRERSIDIVTRTASGYVCSQLHPSIGTTATNTVVSVPGKGIMFLSSDGVYLLSSRNSDSAFPTVQKLSDPVGRTIDRLNKESMPRATAVYSNKFNEYWCHFPADGSPFANVGVVFHTATDSWSVRGGTTAEEDAKFKFHRLFTDRMGNVLIAPSVDTTDGFTNVGIQIVSRCKNLSILLPTSAAVEEEEGIGFTEIETFSLNSRMVSNWNEHKPSGKPLSVTLRAYQTTANKLPIYHFADNRTLWNTDYSKTSPFMADYEYDTLSADAVWETSSVINLVTLDSSTFSIHRLIDVKSDVYVDGARKSVAWGYKGTDWILLQGYTYNYNRDPKGTLQQ